MKRKCSVRQRRKERELKAIERQKKAAEKEAEMARNEG